MTRAPIIMTSLPIPHTPIVLAKYCSRFQYTQISSNSLLNFRWKSRIIESISEQLSILFQCIIIIQPVVCNILYTAKPTAIPRAVIPFKIILISITVTQFIWTNWCIRDISICTWDSTYSFL